jgi:hypothetical protein
MHIGLAWRGSLPPRGTALGAPQSSQNALHHRHGRLFPRRRDGLLSNTAKQHSAASIWSMLVSEARSDPRLLQPFGALGALVGGFGMAAAQVPGDRVAEGLEAARPGDRLRGEEGMAGFQVLKQCFALLHPAVVAAAVRRVAGGHRGSSGRGHRWRRRGPRSPDGTSGRAPWPPDW